ncbi:MAG: hypothetical protein LC114_04640, partial [Bryobacterales bacterium]|nr:hypothetical protein [Bryobacterales bacterium]
MASGFMIGSECADWWKKRNEEYHDELEQYVLDNPGYFAVFVATAKATAADYAMVSIVDLARLGEGMAEGTVEGIVRDVFRLLAFLPQGKVLQGSKTLFGRAIQVLSNLRIWRALEGGLCVPISIAQALQRGGYKVAVSLKEIADALGSPLIRIFKDGTMWHTVEGALKSLGVQFSKFDGAAYRTLDALKRLASEQGKPLLVRIVGGGEGHAILVGPTASGVKIIDRVGMFNTLE